MPPFPRNKTVDVVYDPAENPPFALKGKGPAGQRIRFRNKGHPGVVVCFEISDAANNGLEFQPVPSQALTVDDPADGDNLVPISVEKDEDEMNTRLIAYCRNEEPAVFKFSLHFLQNGQPVTYDPIGDGENGDRV